MPMPITSWGWMTSGFLGSNANLLFPLFCEEIVEETIRRAFQYAFEDPKPGAWHSKPKIAFERLMTQSFQLCGLTIQPLRLLHGKLPILGFRINDVAFCTDVSHIPDETWPKLMGLKVLILDAIRDEPHPTHFNVPQALEVIDRAQPERAFLTHISHTLDHEATNRRLPGHVELAYDGLVIPL